MKQSAQNKMSTNGEQRQEVVPTGNSCPMISNNFHSTPQKSKDGSRKPFAVFSL
jgi:hypothetical protein